MRNQFRSSWKVALLTFLLAFYHTLLLGSSESAESSSTNKVAILVNPDAWKALEQEVKRYVADVTESGQVTVSIVVEDFHSPEQVQKKIKSLYDEKSINGAILVGAIPMHRFFIHENAHENASPNPLYYEDFDLFYHDDNGDGIDDRATGIPNFRIWVANIRSTEQSDENNCEGLRKYFSKVHQLRAGELTYENRSIIVTDAELGLRSDEARLGRTLFGPQGVDLLATPKNKLSEFRKAFEGRTYAICTMGVHSDWTGQELSEGDLSADEIQAMKTGAILTLNHGCYSGNWCASEREGKGLATAPAWVFGQGDGVSVIANVRSGCIYGCETLCDKLSQGESIGTAYLHAKRIGEKEMRDEYPDGSIISGVLLLGDPFLAFSKKSRPALAALPVSASCISIMPPTVL